MNICPQFCPANVYFDMQILTHISMQIERDDCPDQSSTTVVTQVKYLMKLLWWLGGKSSVAKAVFTSIIKYFTELNLVEEARMSLCHSILVW